MFNQWLKHITNFYNTINVPNLNFFDMIFECGSYLVRKLLNQIIMV